MQAFDTILEENPSDIFDAYFELMEGTSESPLAYHRWSLISTVAALLGRNAYLPFGHSTIYPNMFVCLLGDAGTRKSSAISITRKLLESTGYSTFARERTSKEKFIKDLGDGFDTLTKSKAQGKKKDNSLKSLDILDEQLVESYEDMKPSEVFITAGELEDFLGAGDTAFISLLTNLWDNLDHYSHGKMTSEDIFIKAPTLNLIGGATPTTFNTVFPPEVIGQGMMSRLILVYGGGVHKKITIPKKPDEASIKFFQSHLKDIKRVCKGEFSYTAGAYEVIDTVYQGEIDLQDYRLESYINRRHIHLLKLCMVIAALNLSKVITKDHAILANSILHYTERNMGKALGEFGKNIKGDTNTRLLQAIDRYHKMPDNKGKVLTVEVLFKLVHTDYNDMQEFGKSANKLRKAGKIEYEPTTKGFYCVKLDLKAVTVPFVNFDLIPESKQDIGVKK